MVLSDIPAIAAWGQYSSTYLEMYNQCVSEGVLIDDSRGFGQSSGVPGTIYISGVRDWNSSMTADDAIVLAHEMRHATQEGDMDFLDMERDAFSIQDKVFDEFVLSGLHPEDSSRGLCEEDILEAYGEYLGQ